MRLLRVTIPTSLATGYFEVNFGRVSQPIYLVGFSPFFAFLLSLALDSKNEVLFSYFIWLICDFPKDLQPNVVTT